MPKALSSGLSVTSHGSEHQGGMVLNIYTVIMLTQIFQTDFGERHNQGMILRIASSCIVGQDIAGRWYFSSLLSANSVMRGR